MAPLLLPLGLSACSGPVPDTGTPPADTDTDTDSDTDSDTDTDTDTDAEPYAEGDGPYPVTVEEGSVSGQDVTWYVPEGVSGAPVVLWSHGFARGQANHVTAATHAASWGFLVATPALPTFADHEANATFLVEDLLPAAQARPEAGDSFAYVGHSAGGLASLLAASQSDADALVGLDAVDTSSLGEDAAGAVTAPALFLDGEPSTCNASGSGTSWTTSGEAWRVHVIDATHCDFESDTDSLCSAVCGATDSDRQQIIQTYAVAWLVHTLQGGADAWIQGSQAEADRAAGRIDW